MPRNRSFVRGSVPKESRRGIAPLAPKASQPDNVAIMASPVPARIKSTGGKPLKEPRAAGLSPRVKAAVEKMVFEGLKRPAAAEAVGLADATLRAALGAPLVLRYLTEQMEVLRTSVRPRALQRIAELSDGAASEKVALDASKYLDSNGASSSGVTVNVGIGITPGYVIDLTEGMGAAATTVQHGQSTKQHERVAKTLIDLSEVEDESE